MAPISIAEEKPRHAASRMLASHFTSRCVNLSQSLHLSEVEMINKN